MYCNPVKHANQASAFRPGSPFKVDKYQFSGPYLCLDVGRLARKYERTSTEHVLTVFNGAIVVVHRSLVSVPELHRCHQLNKSTRWEKERIGAVCIIKLEASFVMVFIWRTLDVDLYDSIPCGLPIPPLCSLNIHAHHQPNRCSCTVPWTDPIFQPLLSLPSTAADTASSSAPARSPPGFDYRPTQLLLTPAAHDFLRLPLELLFYFSGTKLHRLPLGAWGAGSLRRTMSRRHVPRISAAQRQASHYGIVSTTFVHGCEQR
jgi:hypothetical protein